MKQKSLSLTRLRSLLLLVCVMLGVSAWGETVTYTLTISASDFNTTSYAANNNEKTSYAVCTTNNSKTYQVLWTSYQVMKNGDNMQWQKSNGYIYNSTDLGTINSVTVNSSAGSFTTYYGTSEHPTSGTTVGNGFFTTKVGSATGTTSSVVISFTITEGGTNPPTPTNPIIRYGSHDNVTLEMWGSNTLVDIADGAEVEEGTEVTFRATADFGYTLSGVSVKDADNNDVELTDYSGSWSFYMPGSNVTISATATSDQNLNTLWSENFSSYSAGAVPTGGDYNYACTNSGTKIYSEALAGGTSPELLVAKSGGSFTAVVPLQDTAGNLKLTFKANNASLSVTTTTEGINVGTKTESNGLYTVYLSDVTTSMTSVTIVFTTTSTSNVRLDDIELKGIQVKVATPTVSPASGAVASGTEVTINCATDGASIKYSYDNQTWSDYSTALIITEATTIYAKAVKTGLEDSDVASATYTIALPCATPTFSVVAGEVAKGTTVTISTTTAGATIYYTTNGSDPTTSSTEYSGAITINSAMTIKAIAAKDGMLNSEIASVAYTLPDYATLPFVWNGGAKNRLTALTGVTENGLGSDYANSNAPYLIKMDGANDYIQIKTNAQPGKVYIGVKMIGGASTSKIKIQQSANGSDFTDVEELTISGRQNDILNLETSNHFAATTRFVKIIKSEHGSNIGVGPITITATETASVTSAGWATFSSTRALDFTNVTGVVANTAVYANGRLTYTPIQQVPANTGVILRSVSGGEASVDVPVINDIPALEEGSNMLVAVGTAISSLATVGDNNSTNYILNNVNGVLGFYRAAGNRVDAGKAYLNVPAGASRSFIDINPGEQDGIESVNVNAAEDNIYDLQGRQVAQPQKGLYIVNGKKVIIK